MTLNIRHCNLYGICWLHAGAVCVCVCGGGTLKYLGYIGKADFAEVKILNFGIVLGFSENMNTCIYSGGGYFWAHLKN